MRLYSQTCGTVLGFGSGGFSLAICVQSGFVWFSSAASRSLRVASSRLDSVVDCLTWTMVMSVLLLRRTYISGVTFSFSGYGSVCRCSRI